MSKKNRKAWVHREFDLQWYSPFSILEGDLASRVAPWTGSGTVQAGHSVCTCVCEGSCLHLRILLAQITRRSRRRPVFWISEWDVLWLASPDYTESIASRLDASRAVLGVSVWPTRRKKNCGVIDGSYCWAVMLKRTVNFRHVGAVCVVNLTAADLLDRSIGEKETSTFVQFGSDRPGRVWVAYLCDNW